MALQTLAVLEQSRCDSVDSAFVVLALLPIYCGER
jgi:hypothetical protein